MAATPDTHGTMLQSRQPRPQNWPNDVATPAELNSLRVPFCQNQEVMVLFPEAVHGAALAYLGKRTPRRSGSLDLWGPGWQTC
eukprot:5095506-Alexandrium_andersonii.AAC.1